MGGYAILFPGQGSQKVGMGADLFDAYPDLLGEHASDLLGWPLDRLVLDGPQDELTRTEHAQPALFAVSYALWTALAAALPTPPSSAAGHSLGEYTALAAASGEPSGMAAVIGADTDLAEQIAAGRRQTGGKLWVANVNAPSQIVLAGSLDDIEWLTANARDLGVRRAIPLAVAGAFHTPYMQPAADRLAAALARTPFATPQFPVYANTTAAPVADPVRQLSEQLVAPVRFSETLTAMAAAGITTFIHVGPGDVTAGLVKRTVPGATIHAVSDLAGIAAVADDPSIQ